MKANYALSPVILDDGRHGFIFGYFKAHKLRYWIVLPDGEERLEGLTDYAARRAVYRAKGIPLP